MLLIRIRTKVAGFDPELAKTINLETLPSNYNNIKEYINEDEVYKVAGINPEIQEHLLMLDTV
jgi:hypothetical protein